MIIHCRIFINSSIQKMSLSLFWFFQNEFCYEIVYNEFLFIIDTYYDSMKNR